MKLSTLPAVFIVLVSLVISGTVFAQLSEVDRTSIFRDDIVRIGAPIETLCHIPPGNPANAQTIDVAQAAVPAHLAHGDLLGDCPYECDGVPAPVPATGQTECWSAYGGSSVPCAGTGQDGEYQDGASVTLRFADNGDGTVTDNLTGLIWLQDANCSGLKIWSTALIIANNLADGACGLTDGSVAGDWRLPNAKELLSLIDYGTFQPTLPPGHPFFGVQLGSYWSSTTRVDNPAVAAWTVSLKFGWLGTGNKATLQYCWFVRGPE